MAKFTPGPYLVEGETIYALEHRGDYRHGRPVRVNRFSALVSGSGRGAADPEERRATARLMAAAPEMYEALEAAIKYVDGLPIQNALEFRRIDAVLRRALAKADGEPS